MGRCSIQVVMGPAGSGKSTYCAAIQQHCATVSCGGSRRRTVHIANLDPAVGDETLPYHNNMAFDIQDLISVEDVMTELALGPNGALIYCMEYLLDNLSWLQDHLENYDDDEYLLLDCPGQLELYTHYDTMKRLLDKMKLWGYESNVLSVFCIDVTFMADTSKFISGSLLSLSAMICLEMPHINILTKCDLVDPEEVENMLSVESATQLWQMEEEKQRQQSLLLLQLQQGQEQDDDDENNKEDDKDAKEMTKEQLEAKRRCLNNNNNKRRRRYKQQLTESICSVLDDYTMVSFVPLNITDEDSIDHVLTIADHTIQYGEDLEVRGFDGNDGDYENHNAAASADFA